MAGQSHVAHFCGESCAPHSPYVYVRFVCGAQTLLELHPRAIALRSKGSMGDHGFTLIEALLSIAIMSILAGLSLPVYSSFYNRSNVDIAAEQVAQALRRAQAFSRGMSGDSAWGVEIGPGSAVVFKGSSYAGRDVSFDETIRLDNLSSSGLSEVVFSKLYGLPEASGSITLASTNINDARTITLNAKGLVTY